MMVIVVSILEEVGSNNCINHVLNFVDNCTIMTPVTHHNSFLLFPLTNKISVSSLGFRRTNIHPTILEMLLSQH
jgi:hypothetical protein